MHILGRVLSCEPDYGARLWGLKTLFPIMGSGPFDADNSLFLVNAVDDTILEGEPKDFD